MDKEILGISCIARLLITPQIYTLQLNKLKNKGPSRYKLINFSGANRYQIYIEGVN